MANYNSSRTGQAHDNDENRLTTLENNTSCLSSSGTTGQFLRGDKTWNNALIGSITISDSITTNKFHSNAVAGDTDLTRIPSDNEIALETGNGDGSKSAWVWREKWPNGNYGIFHNNSTDVVQIVGANSPRLTVSLADGSVTVPGTITCNSTIKSTRDGPAFLAQVSSGTWAYLRLHDSSQFWDIACNSSRGGELQFRSNGSDNYVAIAHNGMLICQNAGETAQGLYTEAAQQVREYRYAGANSDTWGHAPRLAWHWAGRVAAQVGLASNGWLYEAPLTGTSFYRINTEGGSSRTIKHDIKDLPNMGDKLDQLKPVSFIYNYDKENEIRYGLIHEDTVDILPDICKFDDKQDGGRVINYIDLIPVLIKEIQDLRARVKELEQVIDNGGLV